jgi:hypothetical protein
MARVRQIKRIKPIGRYSRREADLSPGPELEPEGSRADGKIEVAHGDAREPSAQISISAAKGKSGYAKVAVNARCDVLEREYRYNRISPLAYAAGNNYLAIMGEAYSAELRARALPLEPSAHGGVDRGSKAIRRMERAMLVSKMRLGVTQTIGKDAVAIIDEVLGTGETEGAPRSLYQIAADRGFRSQHATKQFCREFRLALEDLAIHWGHVGWPTGV